jgi:endoglucanase
MRVLKFFSKAFVVFVFLTAQVYSCDNSAVVWRGFNVGTGLVEKDFIDMRNLNVNAVRVSFVKPAMFLDTGRLNPEAIRVLDKYLQYAKLADIRLVVDVHTYPGSVKKFSGSPLDMFWSDPSFRKSLANGFGEFVDRYLGEKTIVAIDVINEPAPPVDGGNDIYFDFLRTVVNVFKSKAYDVPIIVQPPIRLGPTGVPQGQYKGVGLISEFAGNGVIKSIHYYEPGGFTHQGVLNFSPKNSLKFPLNSDMGLAAFFNLTLQPLSEGRGSRVLIGEFGASNYSGVQGDWYIEKLIDVFEVNGWSWFFHSFREADVWSPEFVLGSSGELIRSQDSPRISVLKKYFSRNKSISCLKK